MIAVLRNTIVTGVNLGFTSISPKVNSGRLYGYYKMGHIQKKLSAYEEAFPSKIIACFFGKTGHAATEPLE